MTETSRSALAETATNGQVTGAGAWDIIFDVIGTFQPRPRARNLQQCPLVGGGVLLLIALFVVLRPLAAASPPDPTWIAGVYDDGDFDNVVAAIGGMVGISEAPSTTPVLDWPVATLPSPTSAVVVSAGLLSVPARSPPQP